MSPEIGHRHELIHRPRRPPLAAGGAAHQSGSTAFVLPDRHEHGESDVAVPKRRATTRSSDGKSSLILAAGAPSEPMEASLRNVALTLAGLSVGIWLLAAFVGRSLCNRALLPVTRMAKAACAMTAVDRDQRLPSPATGDELDALANSFNGLLDRLHEEFERQKRFTGDASHQLRTPLTALLGQLEVARRRERSVAEYQRVLDDVHGEAVKLCQIVEALLFMARAETEAGRPDLQPLELVSWVHDHLGEWAGHPRSADLREEIELDAPAWVRVHSPLLGQLLDNLLDNACKYSAPGTPIVVRLWREGRDGRAGRAGPWSRLDGRRPAPRLRALLPLGRGTQARAGRSRPGPGGRPANRGRLRRHDHRGERAGTGKPVRAAASRGHGIDPGLGVRLNPAVATSRACA